MRPKIPTFKKDDYILGFESAGNSFIFEDLVVRRYMPEEYLTVNDGKKLKVLLPHRTVKLTNDVGLKRTPEHTQRAIDTLNKEIELAWKERDEYLKKESFELPDLEVMVKRIDALSMAYGYFDLHYWDSTYEKAKTDLGARKNIELIEGYKNKVRTILGDVYFGENGYLETMLLKLSQKFSLSKETLKKYSVNDLMNLFEGIYANEAALNERAQFVFDKKRDNQIDFYVGEEAKEIASIFNVEDLNKKTILGSCAHSTGNIVSGRVRVINRDYSDEKRLQSDMALMKMGEILVSETTEPVLMPAFRKAGAVITDVGGMLSHSAITARELNIPCIVGTGNASKILKSGDMVEVDANNGTVRILN